MDLSLDGGVSGPRPAIRVRPARLSDVGALLAIEAASFVPEERTDARALRHAVRSPTISLLVATGRGRDAACGYVILERRRNSSTARLTSIAIAPDRAGQGIGARLLAAAEDEARRHGLARIRLEVRADNAPARRLYERAGYACFAAIEDYYPDGADGWRYDKVLSPEAHGSSEKRSTSRRSSTKARAP